MSDPDLYAFGVPAGDAIRQALPPIVGDEGGSVWIGGPGHVRVAELTLPADVADGISLGLDMQPDSGAEQVVLGTGKAGGTALRLTVNQGDTPGRLSLLLRDEDGRSLVVHAQGSRSVARRLMVSVKPRANEVLFYENQPWAVHPGTALASEPEVTDAPGRFVFDQPFAMGGWVEDGERRGSYAGRLAQVFIGAGVLDESRVAALAEISTNPCGLAASDLGRPSSELRSRFARDIERLRGWYRQPAMTLDDMDDSSVLASRWVLDKRRILPTLCSLFGVQLWLPGASERSRDYVRAALQLEPSLMVSGAFGPHSSLGFEWVTLEFWLSEPAFHVQDRAVTRSEFIKFVRHKLGGAHFDEVVREKWQRDLLSATAGLRLLDQDALAFQMGAIVGELTLAAAAARLEPLVADARD
jgi:hypothetical protein